MVGDEAGWRQIERRGEVPLYRVVAFGEGFLARSTDGNRIALWTSLDGETWAAVPEVPQPANATWLRDADLVVAGGQVVIVGWTETGADEGVGSLAIVGSTQLLDPCTGGTGRVPTVAGLAGLAGVERRLIRMAAERRAGRHDIRPSTPAKPSRHRRGHTVLRGPRRNNPMCSSS